MMGYAIPTINTSAWLLQVVDLFNSVLTAVWSFGVLRFFACCLLFVLVIALIFRLGKASGR